MKKRNTFLILVAFLLLIVVGCTKPYVIIQPLDEDVNLTETYSIGQFTDRLPFGTKPEDKPTEEFISSFKSRLHEDLAKNEIFDFVEDQSRYQLTGEVLEYKKGSGFLRFLVGFGAGNAKFTVNLKFTDLQTGQTIFSGNFSEVISSEFESSADSYKKISKNFVEALKKEIRKF